jgi:hypothetical protein
MEEQDYINQIEHLNADQIAEGISEGKITFKKLRETGIFDASKQKSVKNILQKKDDEAYFTAHSIEELKRYLSIFPNGSHVSAAQDKIQKIQDKLDEEKRKKEDREKLLREIKEDINEYRTDEIIEKLSDEDLDNLCDELNIDSSVVRKYQAPTLRFNENDIPKEEKDIPAGYTDIFFWGIPSSGKTCALAAILGTIKKNYSMEAPESGKKFGASYRESLVNIFRNDTGYLPGRTRDDITQYIPFLLYKRGEKNKRKVSFFELSGEVFKYFHEEANNSQVINDYNRDAIEKSFETIDLLLKSNNQKIHFFFIDYNKETKHTEDNNGLTQINYLEAAATYFRDRSDIFKRKTDAVYVIITKSDEIKGENKVEIAKDFLQQNFGSFMDVLKNQCNNYSVDFKIKLFSIGDVYFKSICKLDRSYSEDIIKDLLVKVKPANNNRFKNFFNS